MKKKINIFIFLILFTNNEAFSANSFFLIGIDPEGKIIEAPINKRNWKRKVEDSITYISQNTLNSLNKIEEKNKTLNFERIDVGAYIKVSLGIGNILKGTAEPYFKLFFNRNESQK